MADPQFPQSGKDPGIKYLIFLDYMHCIARADNMDVHAIHSTGTDKKASFYNAPTRHQGAPAWDDVTQTSCERMPKIE